MGQSGSSARRRRDDQRHHSNPPPQPHPHPHPHPNPYYYSSYAPSVRHYNPFMSRSGYPGYFVAGNGAGPWRQPYYVPASPHPPPPPPPYVERQSAKTVKNDVHVHRDTIRISMDERGNDQYLVSFVYDAVVDGSVTIFYFAKEGADCCFSSIYPDMHAPVTIPFQKGMRQNFSQPSGTGIDLGFFELEDLSKPQPGDVFPLVIYAEACQMRLQSQEGIDQTKAASCAQITQAVIEKNSDGAFMVKVVKQILWVDGERYELQEIFGLESSGEAGIDGGDDNDDMGKECVICMSEPRDTAVFPCRHMCMCSECAKALRLQSNKCPICRQPVEKLMEIKVKGANH